MVHEPGFAGMVDDAVRFIQSGPGAFPVVFGYLNEVFLEKSGRSGVSEIGERMAVVVNSSLCRTHHTRLKKRT